MAGIPWRVFCVDLSGHEHEGFQFHSSTIRFLRTVVIWTLPIGSLSSACGSLWLSYSLSLSIHYSYYCQNAPQHHCAVEYLQLLHQLDLSLHHFSKLRTPAYTVSNFLWIVLSKMQTSPWSVTSLNSLKLIEDMLCHLMTYNGLTWHSVDNNRNLHGAMVKYTKGLNTYGEVIFIGRV